MNKTITETQWLNKCTYQDYQVDGGTIIIRTTGQAALRLDVCTPETVRVWVDPQGSFQKKPSYAVEHETWEERGFVISDQGDYLRILTEALSVRVFKTPLQVDFYGPDDVSVISTSRKDGAAGWNKSGNVSLYHSMGTNEHFYGLGQDNDAEGGALDRRGTSRDMLTGQTITKGCVTADIPVTFFMSTGQGGGSYGMFVDNSYRMEFNMGKGSDEFYYWQAEGGELLYYFMAAPSFSGVLEQFTRLTGRPSMLPMWALGFIQSKCSYQGWDETDDVIETMRDKEIPLDSIVFDFDWAEHMMNFKWHPRWNNISKEKIEEHKANGVKFVVSNSGPMIKKESSNFEDGVQNGIFATDGNGNTVTCGHYGGELMDFTAPNMKEWLWPQLKPIYDEGVQGWWLDLIEPEGEPLQTVYQGGSKEEIHNVYALLNTKAYFEMQKEYAPDSRPFILGRTGTAGIQKYGTSIWTGDVFSDYETFAAHCPEALNSTMSGISAWTSDAGGFISSTYDPTSGTHLHLYNNDMASQGLLFERWMQFACFSPITRSHHVGPSSPYSFGSMVESSVKHYLQLRYRLMPYIYSYFCETHRTGSPIMRALVFEYQNDPAVFNIKDQYLFGRELMIAPVLTEFTQARSVYFPEGQWIDYDYGYVYEGKRSYSVYAPQNRIPVFVKAGAMIPMAPIMQHTGEKPWDPITLDIYPNGESSFEMYSDDGNSMQFETESKFTETVVNCSELPGKSVTVTINESNKLFTPATYEFMVHLQYNPKSVVFRGSEWNGQPSHHKLRVDKKGWYWNKETRCLYISIDTNDETLYEVSILTDSAKIAWPAPPVMEQSGGTMLRKKEEKQASGQMPYLLPPATVPCRIQAVNFDRGGEKVAYRLVQDGEGGNRYRKEMVIIEQTEDSGGGYYLPGLKVGSWLEYTVNVQDEGRYAAVLRIASSTGGSLSLHCDERNLSGAVRYASQGQGNWYSLSQSGLNLPKGEHILRFSVDVGEIDLSYLEITHY